MARVNKRLLTDGSRVIGVRVPVEVWQRYKSLKRAEKEVLKAVIIAIVEALSRGQKQDRVEIKIENVNITLQIGQIVVGGNRVKARCPRKAVELLEFIASPMSAYPASIKMKAREALAEIHEMCSQA